MTSPTFIGFNHATPFVTIAFYKQDGSAFKRVCYDQEDIDFVVDQYVAQEGIYAGTTYIQLDNTLTASKDVAVDTINAQRKRVRSKELSKLQEFIEANDGYRQVGGVKVERLPYHDECTVFIERVPSEA